MYKIFTAPKCGKISCRVPKLLLIMKLTVVLLIVTILQVNAASYAQIVSLNVKNTPVKEVLNQLTKQTGYNFLCDADIIKVSTPITLNVNNTALKTVLDQCFANQPVEIVFGDANTVVIKHKAQQTVIKALAPAAIVIKGKVVDSKGQTLPGVSILIKGTKTGAVSDID